MKRPLVVYKLYLPDIHPTKGNQLYVYFECDLANVDDLARLVNEGSVVPGSALDVVWDNEENAYRVFRRRPYMIAKGGFARLEAPRYGFFERA